MKTPDTLSLDELVYILRSVIVFRQREQRVGRKFAERGNIYDRSQFTQNLISNGFLKKGSMESQWSDFCYCRPTERAMKKIDAALEFINLPVSLNARNT